MSPANGARPRVLMLVENVPAPSDRRVWPECLSLRRAGFDVVVISPRGTFVDREPFELREGVEIHRYSLDWAHAGQLSFLREYAQACWKTWRLARSLSRRQQFDVVHAANPPDLLLLTVYGLKRAGARLIFDHHDLVPELYLARFSGARGSLYWFTRAVERVSFALADVVISTNESYRRVAIERGGKRADDVFVVRNGPDLARFAPVDPDPALKRGKRFLLAYVGAMGPQDGIDHALHALARLRTRRDDWHAVFVGPGVVVPAMERLSAELGIADAVEFAGYQPTEDVVRVLSTADVCLAPEPKTPLNDASTMIKIAEYMAIGRPVVCFALRESRVTAGEAALYAVPDDPSSFADCIGRFLDDDGLRESAGEVGRERVGRGLSWADSERSLLRAYERALDRDGELRSRGRAHSRAGVMRGVVRRITGQHRAPPGS